MLAAKAIVLGAVVFAAGLVACLPAYLLGLSLLQSNGFDATYGYAAPTFAETVRGVGGTAVYLAALALLGLGIGAILRHTAAAISAVLGLLWVPLIAGLDAADGRRPEGRPVLPDVRRAGDPAHRRALGHRPDLAGAPGSRCSAPTLPRRWRRECGWSGGAMRRT